MTATADTQAWLRLMTWLSPAFPIGAFAYSAGLEQAVADGLVGDAGGLKAWIATLMATGSVWNDAVLLAESHHACADTERLDAVIALASALSGSQERHRETTLLGDAFLQAAAAWPHPLLAQLHGRRPAYPVAVGAVAGVHGVALEAALAGFLHALVSQLVSVGIRLGISGQRDGTALLAALEPQIEQVARRAAASSLDDLGSASIQADIASLRHETLATRLFRS